MKIAALAIALALSPNAIGGAHATQIIKKFFAIAADPTLGIELSALRRPDFPDLGSSFRNHLTQGASLNALELTFCRCGRGGAVEDVDDFKASGPQMPAGLQSRLTFAPIFYSAARNVVDGNIDTMTPSLTAVPEPSTWIMILSGLTGLGFIKYRRIKKTSGVLSATIHC